MAAYGINLTFPTGHSVALADAELIVRNARHYNHGFLNAAQVESLAASTGARLEPVLVRCGGCRFTAAAQDVPAIVTALENAGEYVRDYSLPAVRS